MEEEGLLKEDSCGPAHVARVEPGSPGWDSGVRPGDRIQRIDGEPMRDLIDYYILLADDEPHALEVERLGKTIELTLDTARAEPGIDMESPVFDHMHTCDNSCIFCFVDQLPLGLKRSLYVKDDDYRLSFLQGNFVTLTNLREADLDRILAERLSPLYVSLHTTNPELRSTIFGNPDAALALDNLHALVEGGIDVHIQIVLMRGLNDGAELDRTLEDLGSTYEGVRSIGVVPVGLSDAGAAGPLGAHAFDSASAVAVLDQLERWRSSLGQVGPAASDEFFFMTGLEVPSSDYYGEYPQLENGIGLTRLFRDSFAESAVRAPLTAGTLAGTALLSTPMGAWALTGLGIEKTGAKIVTCENTLFGARVNVCGLLPGRDALRTLSELEGVHTVLLPEVALDSDGDFIDGMSPAELSDACGLEVRVVPADGGSLHDALSHNIATGGGAR